jgi:hypothetical protein
MAREYIKRNGQLNPVGDTQGLLIDSPADYIRCRITPSQSIPAGTELFIALDTPEGKTEWLTSAKEITVPSDGSYTVCHFGALSAQVSVTYFYVSIYKFTGGVKTQIEREYYYNQTLVNGVINSSAVTYDLKAGDKIQIGYQCYTAQTTSSASYNFVTVTKVSKQVPDIVANKGALVSGGAFQFDIDGHGYTENYSTNEVRVGTWIDGKPIYKKTIDTGALPNASVKGVAHNISNIEWVLDIRGTAKSTTAWITLDRRGSTDDNGSVRTSVDFTQVTLATIANMSSYAESYLTLLYTKTTD